MGDDDLDVDLEKKLKTEDIELDHPSLRDDVDESQGDVTKQYQAKLSSVRQYALRLIDALKRNKSTVALAIKTAVSWRLKASEVPRLKAEVARAQHEQRDWQKRYQKEVDNVFTEKKMADQWKKRYDEEVPEIEKLLEEERQDKERMKAMYETMLDTERKYLADLKQMLHRRRSSIPVQPPAHLTASPRPPVQAHAPPAATEEKESPPPVPAPTSPTKASAPQQQQPQKPAQQPATSPVSADKPGVSPLVVVTEPEPMAQIDEEEKEEVLQPRLGDITTDEDAAEQERKLTWTEEKEEELVLLRGEVDELKAKIAALEEQLRRSASSLSPPTSKAPSRENSVIMKDRSSVRNRLLQARADLRKTKYTLKDDHLHKERLHAAREELRMTKRTMGAEIHSLKTLLVETQKELARATGDLNRRKKLMDEAKGILTSLKPWVGIEIPVKSSRPTSPREDETEEASSSPGVKVLDVKLNSPAELAGLWKGDHIEVVNGEDVFTNDELRAQVEAVVAGDELSFQIVRNKEVLLRTVQVGSKGFKFEQIVDLRRISAGIIKKTDDATLAKIKVQRPPTASKRSTNS